MYQGIILLHRIYLDQCSAVYYRTGDGGQASVSTEVIPVEGDGGSVGVLETLFGFECAAQDITGDDAVIEAFKE